MPLIKGIKQLSVCPNDSKQDNLGIIEQAAVVWEEDSIKWVGKEDQIPEQYQNEEVVVDGIGLVTPGLIDCHTHLAFGGWRAAEFEMRILGKSYLEIAKQGGGILSSVKATREATEEELYHRCRLFLSEIVKSGVTTIECKSGYGLTLEDELKLLRVYKRLEAESEIGIVATFLGAHTIPTEYKNDRGKYIKLIVDKMLPKVAEDKLASFVDVFVEEGAFTADEARQILNRGLELGLLPKLHVDQLSDGGGADLAASLKAASADHLEYTSKSGIQSLMAANTVAVALPIASLYTFQKAMNGRAFIEAGVPVAVATDFNPGTAPTHSINLAMLLACTMNRLTPREVLKATTIYAARALKCEDDLGSIEVGKKADLTLIDAESVDQWLYNFKTDACQMTVKAGKVVYERN